MKKISKFLFLFVILLTVGSINVFAENKTVEFDINYQEVKTSNDGYQYYDLEGWWNPSAIGDYYLILKYGNNLVDLCNFKINNLQSSNINLKYPECNGALYGYVVTSGNSYSVYFSDTSKGTPISSCYTSGGNYFFLDSVQDNNSIIEHDVFTNWNVKRERQGDEYYYVINADVISGETGTVRIVLDRTDGTGEIMVVHPSFVLGTGKKLSVSTKGGAPKLREGEYELTINYDTDQLERPTQTYIIGEKIPASSNGSNSNGSGLGDNSSNGSGLGNNTGSLVSTECGYNLGKGGVMCNFSHLMSMLNRVINFIFVLVLPIAAIVFAYAGYLYIVSAGDPNKRSAAKNAMTKLVIGVVVIMLAWILINTLLVTLGVQEGFSLLGTRN